MRITSLPNSEQGGAAIDLQMTNISSPEGQPALAFSLTPAWSVDANLEVRQTGTGLSNAQAVVHATLGADQDGGDTVLDVTQLVLDLDPIILGDVKLAGRALTVSGAGPVDNLPSHVDRRPHGQWRAGGQLFF